MAKLRKLKAYRTLRQEWANKKNNGMRIKRAKEEGENAKLK